ncbi:MAG TPA: zf-HC2 domain-containing protein [Bacillales bacterium]|nr:zf-HC2 domain-containing protein [Bacillales bacterium]
MGCKPEIVQLMHKVLDEDADDKDKRDLTQHLKGCPECREHYEQLKRTEALMRSTSSVKAPGDLKDKIIERMPNEKRTLKAKRWFQQHPVLTAAALFLLFMSGYLFSLWQGPQQVAVRGSGHVITGGEEVIVPKGVVIRGDLVVRNSDVRIEGKVLGDVTVINGKEYLASAGQVTGEIEEVNALFEWLWYQIKQLFTGFASSREIVGRPL